MRALSLIALLARAALAQPPTPVVIAVHADRLLANLSDGMIGAGIEDVNHELVGGLYTQMIWGESFEEPQGSDGVSGSVGASTRLTWSPKSGTSPARCSYQVVNGDAATGTQSQGIVAVGDGSGCGLVNRGLDASGLFFPAMQTYSGYLYAKLLSGAGPGLTMTVSMVDARSGGNATIWATTSVTVQPGNGWTQYPFDLVPQTGAPSTICYPDPSPLVPCYANAEGEAVCISCSGEVHLTLEGSGSVLLDQVYLSPVGGGTQYGGQPTRTDAAGLLVNRQVIGGVPGMGLNALRLGGSMILADGYRWKAYRGPAAQRQPYDCIWYPYSSRGWGMFELLSLCETAALPVCVVTMNSGETPSDVSDFLEYAYGSSTATVWGAQRAADGHTDPYPPFWIEIGNEQNHTDPAYIAQVVGFVTSLNATASRLALPSRLQVVIGAIWITWPPEQARPMATALAPFTPHMDLYWDFHIGGDSPHSDPGVAFDFIASVADVFASVAATTGTPQLRGAVLEENGSRHDVQRALGHARMSNRMHCLGDVVRVDAPANGLQVAGRNDNSWDQGQLFLAQNQAYLSPAGMAQAVLSASAAGAGDVVVAVYSAGLASAPQLDVIAVRDAAGSQVAVRVVNLAPFATTSNITMNGCSLTSSSATVASLSGHLTAQNVPASPLNVTPATSTVSVTSGPTGGAALPLTFLPYSFTTVNVMCKAAKPSALRARAVAVVTATADNAAGTTCDVRSGNSAVISNISWAGHSWATYNRGPWAVQAPPAAAAGNSKDSSVSAAQGTIALPCNTFNCYDQAIMTDASLPSIGASGVSALVTLTSPSQAAPGGMVMDAGFLVRCSLAGVGPGMDAFNCYEVSLGLNSNGPGTGYILLGAHTLPGSFQQISKMQADVPPGVPIPLAVNMTATTTPGVAAGFTSVTFDVSVDGVLTLTHTDQAFAGVIDGGNVALRAFYQDAAWTGLTLWSQ